MTNRKLWTQEEDTIILALIRQHGTNQWTTVASEMKKITSTARTSKQIRERWYNQLAPTVIKAPWNMQEQAALFAAHERLGSKWKEIAAQLSGRTDNAVKNHFYSTVRRALRRLDKHFGFRDSTRKMRDLKPSALTHFLEAGQTLPCYSQMMELILTFAQWKPTRQNKHSFSDRDREIYEHIFELINSYKKENKPSKKEKTIDSTPTDPSIDVNSTESDQISQQMDQQVSLDEDECFNYFGSQVQTQSWFSIHERDQGLMCHLTLAMPCDYHLQ